MKKKTDKMFVIKKYVMAPNARAAIRKEKKVEVDDLWIDEEWRKNRDDKLQEIIGFTHYEEKRNIEKRKAECTRKEVGR